MHAAPIIPYDTFSASVTEHVDEPGASGTPTTTEDIEGIFSSYPAMVEVVLTGAYPPENESIPEMTASKRKRKPRKKRNDVSSVQYLDNSE
jgi:hypothetical protein